MARKRRENMTERPAEIKAGGGFSGAKKFTKRTVEQHPKAAYSDGFSGGRDENCPLDSAEVVSPQHRGKLSQPRDSAPKASIIKLYSGNVLHHSAKMKLQLFPINESTREELEKDGFHPYLELTLSSHKKISSVLKHLNSKWGSSRIALGKLTLYPYKKLEHLAGSKWTTDNNGITAGDVYKAIGSPPLFQLRYGWLSETKTTTFGMPLTSTSSKCCLQPERMHKRGTTKMESTCGTGEQISNGTKATAKPSIESEAINPAVFEKMSPEKPVQSKDDGMKNHSSSETLTLWDDGLTNLSIGGLLSEVSAKGRFSSCGKESNEDNATLWDDGLTNISIGGLFSEASLQGRLNDREKNTNGNNAGLQDDKLNISIRGLSSEASLKGRLNDHDKISNTSGMNMRTSRLISDSFDAFLMGQTNETHGPSAAPLVSHSSILDAEDTCHAFSFRKILPSWKNPATMGGNGRSSSSQLTQDCADSFKSPKINQENACQESETPVLSSQFLSQDSSLGLSGIKWTESLGPFDLGLSSPRKLISSADSISFSSIVKDLKKTEREGTNT